MRVAIEEAMEDIERFMKAAANREDFSASNAYDVALGKLKNLLQLSDESNQG